MTRAPNMKSPSASHAKKSYVAESSTSKTTNRTARQARSTSPGESDMSDLPSLTHSDTDSLPDSESTATELGLKGYEYDLAMRQRAGRNSSLPLHEAATPGSLKLNYVNLTLKNLVESESSRSPTGSALDMWLRNDDNLILDRINLGGGTLPVSWKTR
ncbi:Hypothetical protein R9X50_00254300 [Acrodontium crateriforme]|uniref:Uncharacterized protein n=1 Tax=Acrodontium crateriforme TaxID=150365 RepID=A0AAQ3M1D2_9PEZI|nr:Hypothetical protein R9X50_00254300 [Acrodontium crateriforme]